VSILDQLIPEPGAFYVMDRGLLDCARLYRFHQAASFFVTRARANMDYRRRYSHPVNQDTGVISDQTIIFSGRHAQGDFPATLRRARFTDQASNQTLIFLTNNFTPPALVIARLYRCRWQVELFFKWIKQQLRIKRFFGTSENAVKSQIWIAVSVCVLVAIVKKRLKLKPSLFQLLQVLSLTMFERTPLNQLLTVNPAAEEIANAPKQLSLHGS
jgi:IS4 transposase